MTRRDELLNRFKNKTAILSELEDLFRILSDEGYSAEDELFADLEKELQKVKVIPEEDREHIIKNFWERHEAERNRKSFALKPDRYIIKWSIAAAILIATSITVYLYSFKTDTKQLAGSESLTFDSLITVTGKRLVRLPDSSTVLLNVGSELAYRKLFNGNSREVSLIGEALFDVTKNPSKPFLVHTGDVTTKVLGTKFNINAYTGDSKVTVTVVHGLVQVGDSKGIFGRIKPDEQMEVNVNSKAFVKRIANVANVVAWQETFISLDHVTFAEAAKRIEKHFKVKVRIENESLNDCIINVLFSETASLKEIVEGISAVRQANGFIKGDSVIIEGGIGGCKPSN